MTAESFLLSHGGESLIGMALSNFPRFIEHGEYKENQYGTSIEAIRSVQAKNKMCLVDVQPEVGYRQNTAVFLH